MRQALWVSAWAALGCTPGEGPGKGLADTGQTDRGGTASDPTASDPTASDPTDPAPTDSGSPASDPTDATSQDSGREATTATDSATTGATTRDTGPADPGITWILVPRGAYAQGCTPAQADACLYEEEPARVITLSRDFHLSATEVTQAQFEALMGYNNSFLPGPEQPVEGVTWHEAAAFTNALSAREGLGACYACSGSGVEVSCSPLGGASFSSCEGYRLPTEAEWEHAARCGQDWRYAGSDVLAEVGWSSEDSLGRPWEVAQKLPNGCGLYDLSGNVFEWTNDWYQIDFYRERRGTDPEGPPSGALRVVRGGNARLDATYARVSYRGRDFPTVATPFLGFRVARTSR